MLRFTSWTTPPVASTPTANTSTTSTSLTNTPTANMPAASTLLVCGVGNSAGFGVLERAETKIVISGRAVLFKTIDSVNDSSGCAVLIVGAKGSGAKVGSSKPLPILSICDGCDQPDRHAVAVFMNNQRVQFSVDMALAQSAGVQFSSNMLELAARVVHR
ncbi:MAG: YfiR family protein [Spongiibacteraceae bacterium]